VLRYLSRYTHRIAISNRRLLSADENGVTFKYKDYRIEGPAGYKTMTLAADEFFRRFLIHLLPKGFHRIRHYGLLANGSATAFERSASPTSSEKKVWRAGASNAVTHPSRNANANPHSTRCTSVPHTSRFRALALFGRRLPEGGDGLPMPASENLHMKRHSKSKRMCRVRDTAISDVVAEIRWLESAHPSNLDASG
jgi:hypothetical protein